MAKSWRETRPKHVKLNLTEREAERLKQILQGYIEPVPQNLPPLHRMSLVAATKTLMLKVRSL